MNILVILILVLSVVAVIKVLTSNCKDKSRQLVRLFFFPRPLCGADPRSMSSWWAGNWFLGERVNDAITSGKNLYARRNRYIIKNQYATKNQYTSKKRYARKK